MLLHPHKELRWLLQWVATGELVLETKKYFPPKAVGFLLRLFLVISKLCQTKGFLEQQKRPCSSLLPASKEGLLSPPDSFSWLCRTASDPAFLLRALLFLGIFHVVPFPHSQTAVVLACFDLSACEHLWPFMFPVWIQSDKSCLTV